MFIKKEAIEPFLFKALLLLLFWLPIPLGSHRPWAWSIMQLWIFSIAVIWLLFEAQKFNYKNLRPYAPIILIFSGVTIWIWLQQISLPIELLKTIAPRQSVHFSEAGAVTGSISLDPHQTFSSFLKSLSYLCLLLLTLILVKDSSRLKILALTLVITGVVQASYGSLMALSDVKNLFFEVSVGKNIANGSFVYKNHFANFLLLNLSIGCGLLIAELSIRRRSNLKQHLRSLISSILSAKALLRIGLAIMVIALIMSRSRMGTTAFFVALTVTFLIAIAYMGKKRKGLIWLFVSLILIDLLIVSNWFGLEQVQQRLAQTNMQPESRGSVVKYGLELVKLYPLTGTGAGSFYSSFHSVQGSELFNYYDFAHNDYLQFAIELGLPATFLLGFIVLLSGWNSFYAIRYRRSRLMRGLGLGSFMAIIGMLIHISVDFNLQPAANASYFIIILAIAWLARYLPSK